MNKLIECVTGNKTNEGLISQQNWKRFFSSWLSNIYIFIYVCFPFSPIDQSPSEELTSSEPLHFSMDVSELHKIRRPTDFEASKS